MDVSSIIVTGTTALALVCGSVVLSKVGQARRADFWQRIAHRFGLPPSRGEVPEGLLNSGLLPVFSKVGFGVQGVWFGEEVAAFEYKIYLSLMRYPLANRGFAVALKQRHPGRDKLRSSFWVSVSRADKWVLVRLRFVALTPDAESIRLTWERLRTTTDDEANVQRAVGSPADDSGGVVIRPRHEMLRR